MGLHTIRRIHLGTTAVVTFAGVTSTSGATDGPSGTAKFNGPRAVAFDGAGHLLVGDTNGLRSVTPAGAVTTLLPAGALFASGATNQGIQAIALSPAVPYVYLTSEHGGGGGGGGPRSQYLLSLSLSFSPSPHSQVATTTP